MIIDSHAHYNNGAYKKPFRYLTRNVDGYALAEGDRDILFQELLEAGIPYSIEPGVNLESCQEVLELCAAHPGRLFPAMGIHPTRVGSLPPVLAAMNMTNIGTQLLTIEAARTRKKEDILRAVMLEPRCAAILSIDDMKKMVDELLEAHGPYMAMYH